MLKSEELNLCFIEDLESPKELFSMVMDYAKKCKKDEWKCFGEAFSPSKITVVIKDEEGYDVGYICSEITTEGDLFVHHGYIKEPVLACEKIVDNMVTVLQWK